MPRYYKDHGRGYDLDRELPFCDVEGVGRCTLTGHGGGGFIMICTTCFEEHFRDELRAWCMQGHGPMVPLTFELAEQIEPRQQARGIRFTTVEYRRAKRLEREAANPKGWVFGTRTEADYPDGYVIASAETA